MREIIGAVFVVLMAFRQVSAADTPIAIELPKDYGKRWELRLDGKNIAGSRVLDELIKAKQSRGEAAKVIILLPSTVSLGGWSNIQGIVDKVGFAETQYFALSEDGAKMIEIKRSGPVLPHSPIP